MDSDSMAKPIYPALASHPCISMGHCYNFNFAGSCQHEPCSSDVHFNPPKVHNYSGLLAIRIFLGFCEGGLLPGMVNTLQLGHTPGLNFTAQRSFTSVQSIPVMSCNYGKRTYPIVRFLYSFYSLEWEYSMHLVRLKLFVFNK